MMSRLFIFTKFLRRWWRGPLDIGDLREFFFCVGDPRDECSRRRRGVYAFEGVVLELKNLVKHFRSTNMFMGIGTLIPGQELEPQNMLYDRLVYDFDSEENPQLAVEKAIEFAKSLEHRFGCNAIVVYTSVKGAYTYVPLRKPVKWDAYQMLWKALLTPYSFRDLVDRNMLQWNRMDRIPYTWNVKKDKTTGEVKRGFCKVIYPRKLRAEEFDWGLFEPLDPSNVEFLKIELPELVVRPIRKRYVPRGRKPGAATRYRKPC